MEKTRVMKFIMMLLGGGPSRESIDLDAKTFNTAKLGSTVFTGIFLILYYSRFCTNLF